MKKQAKSKAKASKRSAKAPAAQQHELPDLVAVMMKIAERLEAVEKKMDLVIAHQGSNQNQVSHQNHARPGRALYQAVCADCRQDCEVPFKPREDRPIYCKECFAKRKDAGR